MVIFPLLLLVIVLLALAVLAGVALVAAGARGGDQTRLTRRLTTVLAHLNGEAGPPQSVAEMLGGASRRAPAALPGQQMDTPEIEDAAPVSTPAGQVADATDPDSATPGQEQSGRAAA